MKRWLSVLLVALAVALGSQDVYAATHYVKMQIFLDIDGDGVKDAGDNWANGLHVTAMYDQDCNGNPVSTGTLTTDSSGYVTLAVAPTTSSICLSHVKSILPNRCWTWQGAAYLEDYFSIGAGPVSAIFTRGAYAFGTGIC